MLVSLLLVGCGADQAMKKGDKYYALGEYYDAAAQYKRAYAQTSVKERKLRGERALKMADCYRRINYTQRAIAAYRNALRYGQQDSMTQLYLGQQLLKNASYKRLQKFLMICLLTLLPLRVLPSPRYSLRLEDALPSRLLSGSKRVHVIL